MTDYLAEVIQQARDADASRERSQQKQLGWSGMSGCRAYMGFELDGAWATDDPDTWRAIAGTALHEWLTWLRREAAVTASQTGNYAWGVEVEYGGITGHVDEVDYAAADITDWKFPSLRSARLWDDPAVLDERFIQPQGYAAGLIQTDRWHQQVASIARSERPTVRILVAPVDGSFSDWRIYERPFDRDVADAALDRYSAVREMAAEGLQLPRDKPYYFCEKWCEHFKNCRGGNGGPDDLEMITDPELAAALERYGLAMEAAGEARKAQELFGPVIRGLRGQARGWQVSMSRAGEGKPVPDLEAIEDDYFNSDVPLPVKYKPGAAPSLNVKRIKEEK